MINEITFRGKNIETGDWEIGALVAIDFKPALVIGSFESINDCTFHLDAIRYNFVDKDTVCVCTGRVDKNGLDIYEADIIKTIFGHMIVEYENGSFYANGMSCRYRLDEFYPFEPLIVGNKFDNDDLYKEIKHL